MLNPFQFLERKFRINSFVALLNVIIAPFGKVTFGTYLLAEILTDCSISIMDLGRLSYYFKTDKWNSYPIKLSDNNFETTPQIKWMFYCLTFLPYMFRMNQNLKKWLVYNHKLQAFNALKYLILLLAQVCSIIYYEAHIKSFKYLYYSLKSFGCLYKYFWDIYYDWGLFHGTNSKNRMLRSQTKYAPWFYYFSMFYDLVGLFSWALVILLMYLVQPGPLPADQAANAMTEYPIEYYNNLVWITWLEFIVVAIRRCIWVVIRVESEFFNNYE